MRTFYKKSTLIATICFMSFFVAINVICSFLTTVLPLLSVILIIFLPLTSAVVEIVCKDRWFPIYAFATIGLSLVVSLSSIDFTILYIIPSVATGYIFGLFWKRGLPSMFAIFFASAFQALMSFLYIRILEWITGTNLLDLIAKIFRISQGFWLESRILLIFFIVALIQIILSFIVVENELKKFAQKPAQKWNENKIATYACLVCAFFAIIPGILYIPVALLFIGFSFYFVAFIIIDQAKRNDVVSLIVDGVAILVGLIFYAALNQYLKDGVDKTLFLIIPAIISIFSICHSFLKKSE